MSIYIIRHILALNNVILLKMHTLCKEEKIIIWEYYWYLVYQGFRLKLLLKSKMLFLGYFFPLLKWAASEAVVKICSSQNSNHQIKLSFSKYLIQVISKQQKMWGRVFLSLLWTQYTLSLWLNYIKCVLKQDMAAQLYNN